MSIYISLLRGINVSGQKMIKMDKLKKLYESLGFKNVRTYIQSGNVIFESDQKDALKLQKIIEKKIEEVFGFDVRVFVRTPEELKRVIDNNPFPGEEKGWYFIFSSSSCVGLPLEELQKAKADSEQFSVSEYGIYLLFPEGVGQTKLSNNFFEKKLKMNGTMRNWNTVNKILELSMN